MARQRAYTKDELLDATERLLIERGYNGFHLKALSEALSGARSTIYEYFSNKEEIAAACMRRAMDRVLSSFEGIEDVEPVAGIRRMLTLFLEHAHFQNLMRGAIKVDEAASERARADLKALDQGHELLKGKMMSLFQRAQHEGVLRVDIPLPIIVAVFYHAIETPNWLQLPPDEWAEELFKLWWSGGGKCN